MPKLVKQEKLSGKNKLKEVDPVEIEVYDDDDISTLDNMSHIRLRYGMYLGQYPSDHAVREILDNSIDEYMNGYGDKILVDFDVDKNELIVEDFARGIPVGINSKTNKPTIQMVFHDANTGGKFGGNAFKVSAGLNGTGLKGMTAIAEFVRAESERDGKRVCIEFAHGKIITPYHEIESTGINGTKVTFRPDRKLLEKDDKYIIILDKLKDTCKLRAFLNKGLLIRLNIKQDGKVTTTNLKYDNGMLDYLDEISTNRLYNMKPVSFNKDITVNRKSGVTGEMKEYTNSYEINFIYDAESTDEKILSFTNGVTNSKGTHEAGFKFALTNIVNKYIQEKNLLPKKHKDISISGNDIRRGMICILNTKVCEAEFTGQTKDELGNKEVRKDIIDIMNESMNEWILKNDNLFKKICDRIVKLAIATENVKAMQTKIMKVSASSSGLAFSSKFVNCESDNYEEKEIFIVEGRHNCSR